eukprot:gene6233-7764_t
MDTQVLDSGGTTNTATSQQTEDLDELQQQVRDFLKATNSSSPDDILNDIYNSEEHIIEDTSSNDDKLADQNSDDKDEEIVVVEGEDSNQEQKQEELNEGVVNAASKFVDGTTRSQKKNRRKFAMNFASSDDIINNNSTKTTATTSTPTLASVTTPPSTPPPNSVGTPSSTSTTITPPKSPGVVLSPGLNSYSSPNSGQTTPYKSSPLSYSTTNLSPNTSINRVDESPPTIGKFQILHHIGQGCFGNTYSGVVPHSSEYLSIKIFDRDRINVVTQNVISNDFQILKNLKHSGIVNYISIINDNSGFGITQEFIENGSLHDIYNRSGQFSEILLSKYTLQILEILSYVHSNGITHKNLKSNNILLAKGGKCKLSDFGVGCKGNSTDSGLSLKFSLFGQPYWMAPELLMMKEYGAKVDVWGLGCVILELITGKPPYYDMDPMEALLNIVNPQKQIDLPTTISKELKQFLQLCFKKDPSERASVQDLQKHVFLSISNGSNLDPALINPPHQHPSGHQSRLSINSSETFNLDFLSQSERNEKEISQLSLTSPPPTDLTRFEFQHYSKIEDQLKSLSPEAQIQKLKAIIDHNQTIGNNLKYTVENSQSDQIRSYELCINMKLKMQEILDQNKTSARISARSNMLLKRTNQMASELTKKNENLITNIKRLEDYFITKDDYAKKLANVVYKNKTSFDSLLNPTLAAPVHYQIGSKVWKKGQEKRAFATLKDNFLFLFKNEKSSYPMDVVYLNDRKALSVLSTNPESKKKAYYICIGTTVSSHEYVDISNNTLINNELSTTFNSSTSNGDNSNSSNNNSNSLSNEFNTPGSPNLNPLPPTTLWCLLAFDNQKNLENWMGVLEASIPWYDKKPTQITKPTVEKKHQKQKSLDSSDRVGGTISWNSKKDSTGLKFPGVFGIKLEELMLRENASVEIPYFLTKMMKFLEKHLQEEGILRLSGSTVEIQELKSSIQKGENIDYSSRDPHAVTGLLKSFLRELPEPIIPEQLRQSTSDFLSNSRLTDKDKVKEVLVSLSQLPRPNYNLLKHMLLFAKRVTDNSDTNKMVLNNVTTCFAPSMRLTPGVFSFLIINYDQCFPKFNLSI